MKLWLLERIGATDYDETAGMVVCAPTAREARKVAAESECYQEGIWLSAKTSTCSRLTEGGAAGVILRDFRAG